jgi:uncharacterized protein (DUF2235 family)
MAQGSFDSSSDKKRIVLCCDGTWNKPDMNYITNIEKIARSIEIDRASTDGTQQLVEYEPGVGVSYAADRILGGAFGLGLSNNVRNAYRFLALNYRPGDEIFIFGFSRGAYTARAVAGALNAIGLLTRQALVDGRLGEALQRYKAHTEAPLLPAMVPPVLANLTAFRRECCHPADEVKVAFLGVFDTVGALGVPGMLRSAHDEFADTKLGACVQVARQALAIDERRRIFEPCLWQVADAAQQGDRIKQVWFEGVHSDVGGGYQDRGLSNTTLRWMTDEARTAGLVFDEKLLDDYVNAVTRARRHNSLSLMYKVDNPREQVRSRWQRMRDRGANPEIFLSDGSRNLRPQVPANESGSGEVFSIPVKLASVVREDYQGGYRASNVKSFMDSHPVDTDFEEVHRLPTGAEIPTLAFARQE